MKITMTITINDDNNDDDDNHDCNENDEISIVTYGNYHENH